GVAIQGASDRLGAGSHEVVLLRSRSYSFHSWGWAIGTTNLTGNLGSTDYALKVGADGAVSVEGGSGSFSWSGQILTARVVPVTVTRNDSQGEICLARIECVLPNEAVKVVSMLAGRRYEVPGLYNTPPQGPLLTVPAGGPCSPTTMSVGGGQAGFACNVPTPCPDGMCPGAGLPCPAPDQCHEAPARDPLTGLCGSAAARADGTACDDGNLCTHVDSCQSGACVGSRTTSCANGSECTAAGTCNPATGMCSEPTPLAHNLSCAEGAGVCNVGACVSAQNGELIWLDHTKIPSHLWWFDEMCSQAYWNTIGPKNTPGLPSPWEPGNRIGLDLPLNEAGCRNLAAQGWVGYMRQVEAG